MIEMGKKYRTRGGLPVRVICTDVIDEFPVVALIQSPHGEVVAQFSATGKYNPSRNSDRDLIEICPYDDFKIDEPVMVSGSTSPLEWRRRHFAGVDSDGVPQTWCDYGTSWSTNIKHTWANCRRPTEGELK